MKKIIFLMILVISSFNFACANEDNLNLTIKEKMPKANFSKQDSIKTNKLFIDYLREIEINIQRNWIPPVENKSQRVVVRLTIGKDGKILDTKILRTESEKANKQALLALEKTTFLPLPKEYNGDTVEILFNFDNNFVKAISARNSSQNSKTPSNATEILYMSIDWAPYIRNIENKIKSNWKPVKKERSTRTVAEYTINKKGELLNTKIIQSSGADEVDEQALFAIKNSAPFEPLPQE